MPIDALITIGGSVLSALATYGPAVYRAIVPDGRSPGEVIADARAAVQAIPHAPAAAGIDAGIAARPAAPVPHITADRVARLQRLTSGAVLSHEERDDLRALLAAVRL